VVAVGLDRVDQRLRPVVGLFLGVAAELHHQPARPFRQFVQRVPGQVLLPLERDQHVVQALARQRGGNFGISTRSISAVSTVTSVDSLPTRAFATWNCFSGSR
jgi:hypothetical protein